MRRTKSWCFRPICHVLRHWYRTRTTRFHCATSPNICLGCLSLIEFQSVAWETIPDDVIDVSACHSTRWLMSKNSRLSSSSPANCCFHLYLRTFRHRHPTDLQSKGAGLQAKVLLYAHFSTVDFQSIDLIDEIGGDVSTTVETSDTSFDIAIRCLNQTRVDTGRRNVIFFFGWESVTRRSSWQANAIASNNLISQSIISVSRHASRINKPYSVLQFVEWERVRLECPRSKHNLNESTRRTRRVQQIKTLTTNAIHARGHRCLLSIHGETTFIVR